MTLTRTILFLLAAMFVASTPPLTAQVVRVTVPEENFRKEPSASSNNRLATVLEGTRLAVREQQGRWTLGELEGWIWAASVETTDRDGFDLIVTKTGGENLRRESDADAPRAAILMQGMLLDSLGSEGDWRRVRRAAWIWSASTAETGEAAPPPAEVVVESEARTPSPADRIVVGSAAAGLLVSPEGDTAAVLGPGTDLEVLGREGAWTRVRLEGWVSEAATLPPDSVAGDFTVADLRANPEQFRGRRVEWTLRFVALQHAEEIRTDFYEGEPFILARTRD
ncbi:MAG: hypothetical protein ACOC9N_01735, partial [Gemmatimonadota bacterium]